MQANCSTLPAAFVTKLISPKTRLLPALSTVATPSPARTMTGSAQFEVVSVRMNQTKSTAITVMSRTSATVPVVASAVETASPVSAPVSPAISRTAATASILCSSEMVSV